MSCPAQNAPLKVRLQALEGDGELPTSFYLLTVMMVAGLIGLPYLYRRLWVLVLDFIEDIKADINLPPPPAGCKQYGKLATRNLSQVKFDQVNTLSIPQHSTFPSENNGELESTAASPDWGNAKLIGKVEALYIHPIKSCHGIEVETAQVSPLGFAYDRLFSFAQRTTSIPDPQTGKVGDQWVCITQRSHPRLQMVKSQVWIPDSDASDYDEDSECVKNGGCMVVQFPFQNDIDFSYDGIKTLLGLIVYRLRARDWNAIPQVEFRVPITSTMERAKEKGYPVERMKIWRETPDSWNMSPEIPQETLAKLQYFIGVSNPFTMFRIQPGFERDVYKCSPAADKLGYQPAVGFQDGYPLNIQNMASINAVESAIKTAKHDASFKPDSRRYRANIYVSGPTAFLEAHMLRMAIQGQPDSNGKPTEPLFLSMPARCPRCVLPNNDPSTGIRPKKPYPLKYLRGDWVIDKGSSSPVLGMNAVPFGQAVGREVHVGDEIIMYRPGEHLYNPDPAKEAQTEMW